MNLKEIKELIRIIDASSLDELHLEQDNIKLTLKKSPMIKEINKVENQGYISRTQELNEIPKVIEKEEAEEEELHIVKSPIVGIFYSAPNPESPEFVKVGDRVKVGQVLCIVEAMKLMNEIVSDVNGEIIEVLVQNQGAVEYGQPLFKIRKAE